MSALILTVIIIIAIATLFYVNVAPEETKLTPLDYVTKHMLNIKDFNEYFSLISNEIIYDNSILSVTYPNINELSEEYLNLLKKPVIDTLDEFVETNNKIIFQFNNNNCNNIDVNNSTINLKFKLTTQYSYKYFLMQLFNKYENNIVYESNVNKDTFEKYFFYTLSEEELNNFLQYYKIKCICNDYTLIFEMFNNYSEVHITFENIKLETLLPNKTNISIKHVFNTPVLINTDSINITYNNVVQTYYDIKNYNLNNYKKLNININNNKYNPVEIKYDNDVILYYFNINDQKTILNDLSILTLPYTKNIIPYVNIDSNNNIYLKLNKLSGKDTINFYNENVNNYTHVIKDFIDTCNKNTILALNTLFNNTFYWVIDNIDITEIKEKINYIIFKIVELQTFDETTINTIYNIINNYEDYYYIDIKNYVLTETQLNILNNDISDILNAISDLKKVAKYVELNNIAIGLNDAINILIKLATEKYTKLLDDSVDELIMQYNLISNNYNDIINILAQNLVYINPDEFFKLINKTCNIKNNDIINNYYTLYIQSIEKQRLRNEILGSTIIDLNEYNGFEFEDLMVKIFKKLNYNVIPTKKTGDQGADTIIEMRGKKTVVQLKHYTNAVTNKAIQEVVASKAFYSIDNALVITTSSYTKSAIELAKANNVELWDFNILYEKSLQAGFKLKK